MCYLDEVLLSRYFRLTNLATFEAGAPRFLSDKDWQENYQKLTSGRFRIPRDFHGDRIDAAKLTSIALPPWAMHGGAPML